MKTRLLLLFAFVSFTVFAQTTNPLHEKSKAVLTCFEKGNFVELEKFYDETMKKEATAEKMKEFWKGLLQQFGSFVAISTISDSTFQQFQVIYMNCIFQNSNIMMKTFFDKNERVAGLLFIPIITSPASSAIAYEKSKAILACFEKGDYVGISKDFDETMKAQLSASKLKEVWNMLNQQAGPYIKPSTVSDTIYQQYRIVYTICIFQNAKLKMKTVFDRNEKVAGLFFVPENAPKP
jgi:hypothetical protein